MSSFALSTVPPFLDGVYLGVNAVPDAWLLIDCPSGCFFKCERIALNHDATSTLFDPMGQHRIVQSGITFADLTMGSESVVEPLVARLAERTRPEAIFLSQASSVALSSNDMEALAERLTERLGVPVVHIVPDTFEGDWLDGWERFTEAIVAACPPAGGADGGDDEAPGDVAPGDVTIVGYLADRLEGDHRANLAELERLLAALDLSLAGVLCGGAPLADLRRAMRARVLVALPYAGDAARRIAAITGATVVDADLPVGIDGTVRFVEAVAAAAERAGHGSRADEAAALIERELSALVPTLERARSRFLRDRAVAIAADPALAAGLAGFAAELGLAVPIVSARTRDPRRLARLHELLADAPPLHVLHDAPVAEIAKAVRDLPDGERPDVLIGATFERDIARDLALGFIELGYPSYLVHAFSPRPFVGFAGALRLVDELVTATQLADYTRNSAR